MWELGKIVLGLRFKIDGHNHKYEICFVYVCSGHSKGLPLDEGVGRNSVNDIWMKLLFS